MCLKKFFVYIFFFCLITLQVEMIADLKVGIYEVHLVIQFLPAKCEDIAENIIQWV